MVSYCKERGERLQTFHPFLLIEKTTIFNMKRIKTKDIDPKKLITKSEYARKIKSNPVHVQRMIERGELTIVVVVGAELIHQ